MTEHSDKNLVEDRLGDAKAQNLIDSFTGLMIAVVVGGAVAIPVIQDVLNNAGVNGTAATVLSFVPLGIAVSLFLSSLSPIRGQ